MTPEQVIKKLKTLARTQKRLVTWVKQNRTTAWTSARNQIYERAQETAKIVREMVLPIHLVNEIRKRSAVQRCPTCKRTLSLGPSKE